MKRELEDPEMSIDRPHSNLQPNWHPCSWILAFINTNWKQSKYVGEKGLFGVDIKNHPLCWQPCMQWQHQPFFLLNQCFHAMFKLFYFLTLSSFCQASFATTHQRLTYDQAERVMCRPENCENNYKLFIKWANISFENDRDCKHHLAPKDVWIMDKEPPNLTHFYCIFLTSSTRFRGH